MPGRAMATTMMKSEGCAVRTDNLSAFLASPG
jgi:hypothetical protein